MKVTKNMLMGEVISQFPQSQEIFLKYGLHCVGCVYSPLDTVENGCRLHGMEDEEMNALIDEVNTAIENDGLVKEDFPEKPVEITQHAVIKIKELLESEDKKSALRVSVLPGGCGCASYGMSIENEFSDEDTIIETEGIRLAMDKSSYSSLNGTKVDYEEDGENSGFVFLGARGCTHAHTDDHDHDHDADDEDGHKH